ncbi:MAG: LamG-like jellyroll fold domain-containing protein [Planctomycetota bacterium]
MCKKWCVMSLVLLILGFAELARGQTIAHWQFNGPLGQPIESDIDIAGGYVAHKFYDSTYGANAATDVFYGLPNPSYDSGGTSVDLMNDPVSLDPGVGFFVPDTGVDTPLDLSTIRAFTIEAFIYPYAVGNRRIVSKEPQGYFIITRPDGGVWFSVNRWQDSAAAEAGTVIANEWYHIAGVFDEMDPAAPKKLFVNGELKGTSPVGDRGSDTPRSLSIGALVRDNLSPPGNSDRFFHGRIDEVRISAGALAVEEFLLYRVEGAGSPNPADGATDVPQGTVLSWVSSQSAEGHDVYLGTVLEDVENASRTNPRGVLVGQGQTASVYEPAHLPEVGQTYYWRVDTYLPADNGTGATLVTATASSASSPDEQAEKTIDGSGLDANDLHSVEPTDMWLSDAADPNIAWIEYAFDKAEEFALEFDGQGDYVVTNEQYPFINETGAFAASAWIHVYQHAVSTATWNSIIGRGHAGPFRVAVIQDGRVRCTWDGASRVNLYSDAIAENQWIHVLVQGDGSALQLYMDGNRVDEVAIVPQAKTSVNFAIGTWPQNLGQRVMDGIIDDVRVWNRPLTPQEIQDAVSQELSGNEEGLVGYWKFDEGAGDTAYDSSPTQNHGVISGASWTTNAAPLAPPATSVVSEPGARPPVKLHQMLVWNHNTAVEPLVGFGVKDATIQYSLDGTAWSTLGETHEFAQASGKTDYGSNTVIDFGGALAKYVRITVNSNWGGALKQYGLSEVRFLYVPMTAREPNPASGATDVSAQTLLSWRVGRQAGSHEVYLSTDEQAVTAGTALVGTVSEPSFDATSSTELGQTHYWKVNEVNETEDPAIWEGDVWSFTVSDSIIVDDFESYTDDDAAGKAIWQTWSDGYEVPDNGAQVGYLTPPYAEPTIVHGGKNSMPLSYNNTAGATRSEGTRIFDVPQNWALHGIKTLVLYFHGAMGNTGQLYLKINNAKVTYDGDASDVATPKWAQWNVDLASVGANLENVTTLVIGIEGGGSGIVYLDDIRLYATAPEVPETVWIEAESGSVTAPMVIQTLIPGASGGQYVTVPTLTNSTDNPPPDGLVTIPFAVEGGTYQIQTRVVAPTDGDDSMWLRIEGATTNTNNHSSGWVQADLEEGEDWRWSGIHSIDDGGAVVNFTLGAGQHNLEVAYREDGLLIDAFLITKVD